MMQFEAYIITTSCMSKTLIIPAVIYVTDTWTLRKKEQETNAEKERNAVRLGPAR